MTRDGARSWKDITPPGMEYVEDFGFLGPNRGWAVSTECYGRDPLELYRTEDGGATWRRRGVRSTRCRGEYRELEFVDPSHGWLLHVHREVPPQFLQRTHDGGRSWTRPVEFPLNGLLRLSDPRHGWLLVRDETRGLDVLLVSHDRGASWTRVEVPPLGRAQQEELAFELPTFFGDAIGVVAATNQERWRADVGFYVTSDGGETWRLAAVRRVPDGTVRTHVFGPDRWLIVRGDSWSRRGPTSIDVTRDGGDTWTNRRLGARPQRGWLEFTDPRNAWLIPDRGDHIYRSTDGGRSWNARAVE